MWKTSPLHHVIFLWGEHFKSALLNFRKYNALLSMVANAMLLKVIPHWAFLHVSH